MSVNFYMKQMIFINILTSRDFSSNFHVTSLQTVASLFYPNFFLFLSLVFVGGVVIDCIQALVSAFLLDDSAEDMDEGCLSGPLGN